jgi:hypothetical protein
MKVKARELTIPARMRGLPRDPHGRPIPWFSWPDDRGVVHVAILDQERWHEAVRHNRCWVCCGKLRALKTFALGPINVVLRTTIEPPSHLQCATYAVQVCPFLSDPARGHRPVPERYVDPDPTVGRDGRRPAPNPSVFALWTTRSYEIGCLADRLAIAVGDYVRLSWWTRGRLAMEAEVQAAMTAAREFFPDECE